MLTTRCLLTGEYALVLAALSHLLRDEFIVDCVASNLAEFSRLADTLQPDVVVIDRDPDARGLQLRDCAIRLRPRPAVLFLASREPATNGLDCISRSCSPKQFVAAVRAAVRGGRAPQANPRRGQPGAEDGENAGLARLSTREQQVLREISLGKPMKEVARDLGITPRTVAFHKYRAMKANGLRNNHDLLRFCMKTGLLRMAENQFYE